MQRGTRVHLFHLATQEKKTVVSRDRRIELNWLVVVTVAVNRACPQTVNTYDVIETSFKYKATRDWCVGRWRLSDL